MCTGMEAALIGAAVSAAGTGMNFLSQQDAENKQKRLVAQAEEEQNRLSAQKANLTQNYATENFSPETRRQNLETAAKTNESSLVDSLLKAQGGKTAEVKTAAEGALSDDYTRSAAKATADSADNVLKRARLMARTNAPGLLYNQDALRGGELSSELTGLDSKGRLIDRALSVDMARAQDRGSLAGGLLQGIGGGIAGSGGFGDGGLSLGSATKARKFLGV